MLCNILLIDDDPDDRELFFEALSEIDPTIACETVANWQDAHKKMTGNKLIPSIIFLDINMPGKSGWDCLLLLKADEKLKHVPVVMYSTSSHQIDIEKAQLYGAKCLITKPNGFKELLKVLSGVILAHV